MIPILPDLPTRAAELIKPIGEAALDQLHQASQRHGWGCSHDNMDWHDDPGKDLQAGVAPNFAYDVKKHPDGRL